MRVKTRRRTLSHPLIVHLVVPRFLKRSNSVGTKLAPRFRAFKTESGPRVHAAPEANRLVYPTGTPPSSRSVNEANSQNSVGNAGRFRKHWNGITSDWAQCGLSSPSQRAAGAVRQC